jgi:hypothetical protein
MALFNTLKAKQAGYSDAEIAEFLASQSNFNYQKAKQAGYDDKEIISFLNKQDLSFGEAFMAGAKAEVGSEITGARQLAGGKLTEEELRAENLARQAEEERGFATFAGRLAGGLVNPSTLIPGSLLFKGAKGLVVGGAAAGGASGFLRPEYTDEDMSRGASAAVGAVAGGVLGGALGKGAEILQRKFGKEAADIAEDAAAKVEADTIAPKTRAEIEAELPPIQPIENQLPALLAKAPEADQKYIDDILSRYEEGDQIPAPVVQEMAANVEDKQLAALFRGMTEPPKAADEFVPENKLPEVTAKVEPDVGPSKSVSNLEDVLVKAEATGDYRDYLTKSSVRFADISKNQFEKMVAPDNPFKNQNVKILVSKNDDDQEVLSQIYGALQGRFKYERQTGKTFAEITAEGQQIPESVAVEAFLNRKLEETLPAPVLASALNAASKAISDLHNARDLARVARELGSDEAYAVLQQEMARASALLASIEGNASNLGRSLAYLKEAKNLINQNKPLRAYLGGVRC